jgi:aspartyl-tRNA(Asn)/glutamyl-tRNA(Gln) amidotransferase subunit C
MIASTRPGGGSAAAATYASTSRDNASGVPGYHVPATAAGRIELLGMSDILTPADVERIATLARLELTSDETARFAEQLTAILAYADQVQQVDTSGVALPSPAPVTTMRDDIPVPSLDRDLVLSQAPAADRAAGLFKVPRVLGS